LIEADFPLLNSVDVDQICENIIKNKGQAINELFDNYANKYNEVEEGAKNSKLELNYLKEKQLY